MSAQAAVWQIRLRHQRCSHFYLSACMELVWCRTLLELLFFKKHCIVHAHYYFTVDCTWTGSLLKWFLTCTFPIHKPDKILEDAGEHCCVSWHLFVLKDKCNETSSTAVALKGSFEHLGNDRFHFQLGNFLEAGIKAICASFCVFLLCYFGLFAHL